MMHILNQIFDAFTLDEKPDIVHFSGHGTGAEGLVLVGQDDKPRPATGDALASLFKIVNEIKPVRCVLLNACYAEEQARAIFQHIDNVIGMRREVKDDAAIAFSVGFYDGLARQLPTRTAFDLGCTAIQFELASFSQGTRKAIVVLDEAKEVLEPIPDHLIPILFSRESDAVASASVQAPSFSEALKEDGIGKEEALKQYQERVKEFLDDRELTPIEEFQLATLANVLGLSEPEANRILQDEWNRIRQAKENYRKVLIQTIDKGLYPLSEKIQVQLKERQKALDLTDSDVQEIAQPILEVAEKNLRINVTLSSERGIDYTDLQDLLRAGAWKKADQETTARLCEAVGRQGKVLRNEDIQNFPCTDLNTINQLWVKHSKSKFGFSIQRKIWHECVDFTEYSKQVGWTTKVGFLRSFLDSDIVNYDELTFDTSAPDGHLPGLILSLISRRGYQDIKGFFAERRSYEILFSRIKACKL